MAGRRAYLPVPERGELRAALYALRNGAEKLLDSNQAAAGRGGKAEERAYASLNSTRRCSHELARLADVPVHAHLPYVNHPRIRLSSRRTGSSRPWWKPMSL